MFNIFKKNKVDLSMVTDKRIKKNCEILIKKGLPIDSNMQSVITDNNIQIRSKEEIVSRMIDEFILAHRAVSILNGTVTNDQELSNYVLKFKPNNNVLESLNRVFNLSNESDITILKAQANMYYRVEVYLYVLGIKIRPYQDKVCFIQTIEYNFQDFKDIDDILKKSKMIKDDELFEFVDLIDRYMYACQKLLGTNQTSDKANWHAIIEQKTANDFIIFKNK